MRMMRRILVLLSILTLSMSAPLTADANQVYVAGVMDAQDSEITISYAQGVLYVTGGEGKTVEVVSLTGKKVTEMPVENPVQKFQLDVPKGCYIVKVGSVVRKISVR